MAPRPRIKSNRGLPTNLYKTRDSYVWRDPRDSKHYGLGSDKGSAITQAIEANHHIEGSAKATLLDRLTGDAERTVNDWCDIWQKEHPTARLKPIRDGLGYIVLARVEPLQIATWLKQWDTKLRMRQINLTTARIVFGGAIGTGWIKSNPAADLTTPQPAIKRQRLTLDTFRLIYANANPVLQKAMNIALLSVQRREDVLKMKFSDVQDGYLHVIQEKAKDPAKASKIRIPLSLSLTVTNQTLGGVIGACRDNILSQYVIHHTQHHGAVKPGARYNGNTIEEMFRTAREAAGMTGDNLPTFHEIRSLGIRLFAAQGVDVKTLAGHKSQSSSDLYRDSRGAEWLTLQL